MKYFISYIWWHTRHYQYKNYGETITEEYPLDWLLDWRRINDEQVERNQGEVSCDPQEVHILFWTEISDELAEKYKEELE